MTTPAPDFQAAVKEAAEKLERILLSFQISGYLDDIERILTTTFLPLCQPQPSPSTQENRLNPPCPKCGAISKTMGNSADHSCAECGWLWNAPQAQEITLSRADDEFRMEGLAGAEFEAWWENAPESTDYINKDDALIIWLAAQSAVSPSTSTQEIAQRIAEKLDYRGYLKLPEKVRPEVVTIIAAEIEGKLQP